MRAVIVRLGKAHHKFLEKLDIMIMMTARAHLRSVLKTLIIIQIRLFWCTGFGLLSKIYVKVLEKIIDGIRVCSR